MPRTTCLTRAEVDAAAETAVVWRLHLFAGHLLHHRRQPQLSVSPMRARSWLKPLKLAAVKVVMAAFARGGQRPILDR